MDKFKKENIAHLVENKSTRFINDKETVDGSHFPLKKEKMITLQTKLQILVA